MATPWQPLVGDSLPDEPDCQDSPLRAGYSARPFSRTGRLRDSMSFLPLTLGASVYEVAHGRGSSLATGDAVGVAHALRVVARAGARREISQSVFVYGVMERCSLL